MVERRRNVRADWTLNRERILSAAAQLFAEQGVDVPLDEIAAAAGVGSATLHRHFAGRLDLVHCVLDAQAQRLAAQADAVAPEPGTAAALAAWLQELLRFTASFRGLAVLLGAHQADPGLEDRHRAL